jgi:uncharacterized lipoprotein YddW (UPF0748 family)
LVPPASIPSTVIDRGAYHSFDIPAAGRYSSRFFVRAAISVLCFAAGSLAWWTAPPVVAAAPAAGEVRAIWIQRYTLASPDSIREAVRASREAGFNTLLVQVRGRGEAFYKSDLEPRASELETRPAAFDPLAAILESAHAAGLEVHAWVNVNLVSSAATLPRSRTHVAVRHPDWLMVPRALANELGSTDPRSPGYLGALSRWSRANSATVEGLYLSPLVPAAQDHTVRVVEELVSRYALDGLHLDYIRYPNPEFDYSPAALAAFRAAQLRGTPAADRDRLDRAARTTPDAWTAAQPEAWATFRRARLTSLVERLRRSAQAKRPGLQISAAVIPSAADARTQKLQDWSAWTAAGLLDVVCPMIYTTESEDFGAAATLAVDAAGTTPVWAGIGAYRLPVARAAADVRAARRLGAAGIVVFSYDSFVASGAPPGYLTSLRTVLLESAVSGSSGR